MDRKILCLRVHCKKFLLITLNQKWQNVEIIVKWIINDSMQLQSIFPQWLLYPIRVKFKLGGNREHDFDNLVPVSYGIKNRGQS